MSDRIIKIHKRENPYVQIDKSILNNEKLSWRAKGLLVYLLSLPNDWKVYLDEVTKHSTDKITSTRSAFSELKDAGYVKKVSTRDDKGHITGWETIVYETPNIETESPDSGESTLSENPDVGKPHCGETDTTNNNYSNNEKPNNIKTIADKKSSSAHKQVIDHYHNKFISVFGKKPFIDGGKDGNLVKNLLGNCSLEELLDLLDKFFDSNDPYVINSGYTLGVFKTQINKLKTVGVERNKDQQLTTEEKAKRDLYSKLYAN